MPDAENEHVTKVIHDVDDQMRLERMHADGRCNLTPLSGEFRIIGNYIE